MFLCRWKFLCDSRDIPSCEQERARNNYRWDGQGQLGVFSQDLTRRRAIKRVQVVVALMLPLRFATLLMLVFFASIGAAGAQPRVNAETGGIAIGGSVTSSTINIGIRPEQLAALIKQAADLSESQKAAGFRRPPSNP
jgi:hypothetical protein